MSLSHWGDGRANLRRKRNEVRRRQLLSEPLERRSLLATIQGTTWNDLNGDGKIQFGEPRLNNVAVFIDSNGNGNLDSNSATINFSSSDVPQAIPDLGTVTSQLGIAGQTGQIVDLNVNLNINHTWDEDLDVFLIAPDNTRVELFTDVGLSGQNVNTTIDDEATNQMATGTAPFTGPHRGEALLSAFDGKSPNGTWRLQVTDDEGSDTGTLIDWSLTLNTQTFSEINDLSDANGDYLLTGVSAGTKDVRAVVQTGFTSTFPAGGKHSVTVTANENRGPLNFGQRQAPSSASGNIWDDYDGDGVKDTGEPPLAGKTVFLDVDNDGVLDSSTTNQSFPNNTPLAIPDSSTVVSQIQVSSDQGQITDLNVGIDITHANVSDLTAFLISPSGTRVQLFANVGGSGDDFTGTTLDDSASTNIAAGAAPFTGTFKPAQPLTAYNSQSALGTWRLEITDNAASNAGTLNSWSLIMRRVKSERATTTDANGNYVFNGIAPGSYNVAQATISGRTPTAPRSVVMTADTNFDVTQVVDGREYQPMIAVDPSNPNRLFSVAATAGGTGLLGSVSIDNGQTWTTRILTGADGLPVGTTDPDVAFDQFGNLFLTYYTNGGQIAVANSINGGVSFTHLGNITAGTKPAIAAAEGAVWVSFTRQNLIFVSGASVTGLGALSSFSAPAFAPGSTGYSFSDIEIGPNGEVATTYVQANGSSAPSSIRMSVDPDGFGPQGFGSSLLVTNTNVGTANVMARDAFSTPLYSSNGGAAMAWDRTGGKRDGRVYVVYTDELPEGSEAFDVYLRYSDDNGTTWSTPLLVNTVTNQAQFMPGIAVDQVTADVAVVWYDSRNDSGATGFGSSDDNLKTDVEVMAAVSTDGGDSMLTNTIVSAGQTYVLGPALAQTVGTRIGVAFQGGLLHPAWVDNSNSTGKNKNGVGTDYDTQTATVHVNFGGKAPYHVLFAAGSTKTNLNFAQHLNPALGGFATLNYVEDTVSLIAPGGTVTQPTVPNFGPGKLTITTAANGEATDRLGIQNAGNGAGQVGTQGNQVKYGGVTIGTFAGGTLPFPLEITFNAGASEGAVQAVLRAITFASTSNNPSTAQRQIRFSLTDGHRGTSNTVNVAVNVQRTNDVPKITNFGGAVTYKENQLPVNISTGATFNDPDAANFNGGKLTVTLTANGQAADLVSIQTTGSGPGQISVSGANVRYQGSNIGTYSGGNGTIPLVVTFNAASSNVAVQALIRCLQFSTAGENPSGLTRSVSVVMTDGVGGTSPAVGKSVNVQPVNDLPVLTASGSVGYSINTAPIFVAPSATVTDVDNSTFAGGNLTVHIAAGAESQNRLDIGGAFTVSNGQVILSGTVIGTINTNGGVGSTDLIVTFNANATVARVQQLVRAIRFRTVASQQLGNRAINITVSDGSGGSATAVRTVSVQ